MTFLTALNHAQQQAVTAPGGPILVLAGPGSGKTRVLTYRIAYLIQEMGVAPWHILAVTFTNKAAREMRNRLEELLGGQPRGLSMGTFHATCVRILRRETDNLPAYSRDFVIFDTSDQQQVVKQALNNLNLDDKKFPANKMLNGISNAKNELVTAEMYTASNYISEVTRRVYAEYQELLQANNAMDFDDLMMNTVLLFQERPDILSKYQERYQYILVDEFQDTNTTQYTLLKMLAARHGNLFVVGDSDQSIYKWRGADFRNIQRFREQFPQAQQILLEQNYRSTQVILDAAKAIIRQNPNRVHKELFTEREGGDPVVLREAYNEHEEAEQIVDTIERLMLDGYSGGDMAIMYRTNAQSRVLEETFLRVGLPYRLVGATAFYRRREVKDIIAYLRVIHNLSDMVSFGRIINVPPRGIGAKTRQQLLQWAAERGWQPAEAVIRLATDAQVEHPFSGRALNALANLSNMLAAWIELRDQVPVSDLLDVVLEQVDYHQYLDDGTAEGEERWENVMELRSAAGENPALSLSEFLEQIALVSEADNLEETPNATTLLTLHAAKGLEFPVVFITGLEDGLLPHSRSLDDGEELAEERRLLYVGLTRAKDRVYLSHAFRRTYFGDSSVGVPSRFLLDLPVDVLDEVNSPSARRGESRQRASSWSSSSSSYDARRATRSSAPSMWQGEQSPAYRQQARSQSLPRPRALDIDYSEEKSGDRVPEPQFKSGQRVEHERFGEGTVIESKLTGNDEEVTVAFKEGVKRLAASFANLKVID